MADETQNEASEMDGAEKTSETEVKVVEQESTDLKSVQAALKKANKEAEKYRLKLKEFEDANKSEAERLREEMEASKREAQEARKESMRLQVGLDKGLPKTLISRLQGDTEEEMAADADALLAELKPGKPRGTIDAGPRGTDPADSGKDMDSLLRAAARGN